MNIIYAITKFCAPINLLCLFKQQPMIYFLRHNWDYKILSLFLWVISIFDNHSITTNPFETNPTYTINIPHNIPNTLNYTKLETHPNCKSYQLWLIKVSSMSHNSPNPNIPKKFVKKRTTLIKHFYNKKIGKLSSCNCWILHSRPIFSLSSHFHRSHFLSHQ
jgi:hypothetical protein